MQHSKKAPFHKNAFTVKRSTKVLTSKMEYHFWIYEIVCKKAQNGK